MPACYFLLHQWVSSLVSFYTFIASSIAIPAGERAAPLIWTPNIMARDYLLTPLAERRKRTIWPYDHLLSWRTPTLYTPSIEEKKKIDTTIQTGERTAPLIWTPNTMARDYLLTPSMERRKRIIRSYEQGEKQLRWYKPLTNWSLTNIQLPLHTLKSTKKNRNNSRSIANVLTF